MAGEGGKEMEDEDRSVVGIRRFRRGKGGENARDTTRFIRTRELRGATTSSRMRSPSIPAGIPPVFSFRFRATERRKVRVTRGDPRSGGKKGER